MKKGKSKEFVALCEKYGVNPERVPEVISFEAACKITGDNPKKLPVVTDIAKRHQKRSIADYKLSIIADAIRGGKNVDYTNGRWKYHAVFSVEADEKRPSGFGLSYGDFDRWYTSSGVGVRLCFENIDQAIFFGEHFIDLHTDHHLLT